jgi:hypothetical protein
MISAVSSSISVVSSSCITLAARSRPSCMSSMAAFCVPLSSAAISGDRPAS